MRPEGLKGRIWVGPPWVSTREGCGKGWPVVAPLPLPAASSHTLAGNPLEEARPRKGVILRAGLCAYPDGPQAISRAQAVAPGLGLEGRRGRVGCGGLDGSMLGVKAQDQAPLCRPVVLLRALQDLRAGLPETSLPPGHPGTQPTLKRPTSPGKEDAQRQGTTTYCHPGKSKGGASPSCFQPQELCPAHRSCSILDC